MRNLNGRHAVVTGASEGLGLAMAEALLARGARVTGIARRAETLTRAQELGVSVIAGDATDADLMTHVVAAEQPDILILNAGARLRMQSVDRVPWADYSVAWNTDVKGGLVGVQAALNTPMRPGSRVFLMSSGAAMVMGVPFIDPASLRLSGGYVGAKRMLWYMAHQANTVSRERGLGVTFQVLVPAQLIPGTALGHAAAAAYAALEGVTPEEHVLQRYGSILEPARLGEMVADVVADSRYADGVAYGFRADVGIIPLDVELHATSESR